MAEFHAYLSLDPIKGESEDKDHTGWIELESFSWGASNNSSISTGTGAGIGIGNIGDFHFTKPIDKASMNLFLYSMTGKNIATGTLEIIKRSGDTSIKALAVTLTDVYVTSVQMAQSNSGQAGMESFSLTFVQCSSVYTSESDTGDGSGPVTFNWNQKTNDGSVS